jgi:hypothetical protein
MVNGDIGGDTNVDRRNFVRFQFIHMLFISFGQDSSVDLFQTQKIKNYNCKKKEEKKSLKHEDEES